MLLFTGISLVVNVIPQQALKGGLIFIYNLFKHKMEKQQAIVSIAIALIVCLLGLPVWWHTTKAYRANLPYADIYSLADEAIPKINTKWEILKT